jgi:hypothetical protein
MFIESSSVERAVLGKFRKKLGIERLNLISKRISLKSDRDEEIVAKELFIAKE